MKIWRKMFNERMNQSVNYEALCRRAPAKGVLLKINIYHKKVARFFFIKKKNLYKLKEKKRKEKLILGLQYIYL